MTYLCLTRARSFLSSRLHQTARKRNKDLIAHLQKQVEELTRDKAELKRANEVMRAQTELLAQQNRTLMMNQLAGGAAFGLGGGFGMAGGAAFAMGAGQGLVQGNSMPNLIDQLTAERSVQFQALQQQQSLQQLQQQPQQQQVQQSSDDNNGTSDPLKGTNDVVLDGEPSNAKGNEPGNNNEDDNGEELLG